MLRERPDFLTVDDGELATAAGRGESWARQQLARRLLERTRATVCYLAGGDRDVDDLVQLSMVEVLRSAGSYRREASLETWADRIVVRTSLRQLKQRRSRERVVRLEERPPSTAAPEEGPEDALSTQELRRRLAAHLDHLSETHRAVIVLHWVLGHTVLEVATLTAAPPNTVRKRLRVGKRQLRKRLRRDPVFREHALSMEESDASD